MSIITFNNRYPIQIIYPSEFDPITSIYIGWKSKPCINFLIIDDDAILQDFAFLEDDDETVDMLQTSLKWLFESFPEIQKIELMDMSHLRFANGEIRALPEYYMLHRGKTWYQYHFGATPISEETKELLVSYKEVLNRTNSKKIKPSDLPPLTGQSWQINRATVMKYPVEV